MNINSSVYFYAHVYEWVFAFVILRVCVCNIRRRIATSTNVVFESIRSLFVEFLRRRVSIGGAVTFPPCRKPWVVCRSGATDWLGTMRT